MPVDQPDPPELAAEARRLLRGCDRATLATALATGGGWPYASLVLVACDHDGSPLLLLSGLAEHTRNLDADGRVSLLFDGTVGLEEPLTGARLTVLGRAAPSEGGAPRDRHRARYLARHPSAAAYAGFGDFRIWRVAVERAHLVAGFGRIRWLDAAAILADTAPAAALIAAEAEIVAHMNEDHADALDLYAERLLGLPAGGWRVTGIDPEGLDLRRGGAVGRLPFARPVHTPDAAHAELVRLARAARGPA